MPLASTSPRQEDLAPICFYVCMYVCMYLGAGMEPKTHHEPGFLTEAVLSSAPLYDSTLGSSNSLKTVQVL
jgi:hypothetical protein